MSDGRPRSTVAIHRLVRGASVTPRRRAAGPARPARPGGPSFVRRPRAAVAPWQVIAPLALLVVSALAFAPVLRPGVQSPDGRTVIETVVTLVKALAAVPLFIHFRQTRSARDLVLGLALAVSAFADLGYALLLAYDVRIDGASAMWAVSAVRLLALALIVAGALVADTRRVPAPPAILRPVAAGIAGALAIAVTAAVLHARVGASTVSAGSLDSALASALVDAVLLALAAGAAIAYARHGRRRGDTLVQAMAVACALWAASWLASLAQLTPATNRLYVSDLLRLAGTAALFVGVYIHWYADERRALARAVSDERRRMAADVHDLIMQDLTLALASARGIQRDPALAPHADAIVSAGERALSAARDMLRDLARRDAKPVVDAVSESVFAAARHRRVSFSAAVPEGVEADPPTCDTLVHVAREAVTNALKHARASAIDVTLARDDEWRLVVRDDGRGFEEVRDGGFGLASMKARTEALGGTLHLRSEVGSGTTVEATLP